MNRYKLLGVDRKSGKERTTIIEAATEPEAIAAANSAGFTVARVELLEPVGGPVKAAQADWLPGSGLARAGGWLVVGGLFFVPLAVVGCAMGAAALEVSKGKRGRQEAGCGAAIAVAWSVVIVAVALFYSARGR